MSFFKKLFPPIVVFYGSIAFAIGNESTLLDLKKSKSNIDFELFKKEPTHTPLKASYRKPRSIGNLPQKLIRGKISRPSLSTDNAIIFPKLAKLNKTTFDVGDIFDCLITQDIKAYVGSISPIKAEVMSGPQKGLIFIGNATMDPKTKDIIIEFNTVRNISQNTKHSLKATLHSSSGELGLKGTFHSKYWQYFFATVLSRTAEGYAQASVERDRNIFGIYQEKPSPRNSGKSAVAEAAASTANLVSSRMKSLPEFVTKKGPIKTKVFITATPTLIN